MNRDEKPSHTPGYLLETIEDELLLYHPAETKVMYCNQTASLIWQLCDGKRTVAQITDLLAQAYPMAAAEIEQDVTATLKEFAGLGAIRFS